MCNWLLSLCRRWQGFWQKRGWEEKITTSFLGSSRQECCYVSIRQPELTPCWIPGFLIFWRLSYLLRALGPIKECLSESSWQRSAKERDNNGIVIPFHTFPAFCFTGLLLFVAGRAGCRPLALALVAAYAKLVRNIFAETFNFARFRCMTIFAVLE